MESPRNSSSEQVKANSKPKNDVVNPEKMSNSNLELKEQDQMKDFVANPEETVKTKPEFKEPEQVKHNTVNPEEKNCQGAGTRLTEQMLEYYYQQSKELERCSRKYEEAAYRVYGTIPNGVDPEKFHAKMAELLKKKNLEG